jgi:hypothetical protein
MFKCTIQKAGYDFDKMNDAGNVTFPSFCDMIDSFPWLSEMEKANQMQGFLLRRWLLRMKTMDVVYGSRYLVARKNMISWSDMFV